MYVPHIITSRLKSTINWTERISLSAWPVKIKALISTKVFSKFNVCALKTSARYTHTLHRGLPASFWQCLLHEHSPGTHSGYLWNQTSNLQGSGYQWISKNSGHHQATLTCGNVREYPLHTRNTFKSDPGKEAQFLVPHYPVACEYIFNFFFCLYLEDRS